MSDVMRGSARRTKFPDPTFYPVEEEVGEDILQRWILEVLRPLVERWFASRRVRALVGADQFIYYQQHAPTMRVSPDLYVLPGVAPHSRVPSWKTWDKGIVPSFVLEIVSKDWEKDYTEAPARYAAMGVSELVIFDPVPRSHPDGIAWQLFRRVRERPLTRVEVSKGDRIRSRELGCFLRAVGEGDDVRLRLATGSQGDELFPTSEEAAHAARVAAEADAGAARAAKERALSDRDAALARIAELEAALRRSGKGRNRRRK